MKLVFFAHPSFLKSQSMTRFASMLSSGMKKRGHTVEVWTPQARFFNIRLPVFFKKWMGYVDQYIVFKFEVRKRLKQCSEDTVFVFTDQALGPWVPWINNRRHVIHCHDFLAQRSALGQIKENPTKWFGRQYQAYIRQGFRHGKNFISVSKKTQVDLHEFLLIQPELSEVVYNGLNQPFSPGNAEEARLLMSAKVNIDLRIGYILHIGGNQWYKNRLGVIEIYNAFRRLNDIAFPLLLIGQKPTPELIIAYENSDFKKDIYFLNGIEDDLLKVAYVGASVFVFPSLAEGFGWPIAEAMASGCITITTGEAPMTEVAGNGSFLISRKPIGPIKEIDEWAKSGARLINEIINLSAEQYLAAVKRGLLNAERFQKEDSLNQIEALYLRLSQNDHIVCDKL